MNFFKQQPLIHFLVILIITITFSMTSVLFGFINNLKEDSHLWHHASTITLYLNLQTSDAELQTLFKTVQQYKEVTKAIYLSPDQGLQDIRQQAALPQDKIYFNEELARDLPGVIQIQLSDSLQSTKSIDQFIAVLKNLPNVELVKFDTKAFEKKSEKNNFFYFIDYTLINLSIFISFLSIILLLHFRLLNSQLNKNREVAARMIFSTGTGISVCGALLALLISSVCVHAFSSLLQAAGFAASFFDEGISAKVFGIGLGVGLIASVTVSAHAKRKQK